MDFGGGQRQLFKCLHDKYFQHVKFTFWQQNKVTEFSEELST